VFVTSTTAERHASLIDVSIVFWMTGQLKVLMCEITSMTWIYAHVIDKMAH